MTTHVGFLRAVNVGKRTVPMARLKQVVEDLGCTDVWTYINSGNVVFDGPGSQAQLEGRLGDAFERAFGFEVTTFVRTPKQLRAILDAHPFAVDDGDTYFVTFLRRKPSAEVARTLEASSNDFDTLVVIGDVVHWRMRGKSTDTLLKAKDWNVAGKLASTSRNVTMLRKLVDKLES